ncbi:MAG: glycerol kinase GlpK [Acidobacteriota bacterium]|jgi:glycerol kinase
MARKRFVLALDQGTTSSRALLFDHAGNVAAMAQREFEQIFTRPGWVEHDPGEIWRTQIGVAEEAMRRADAGPADVAAVGITNQRETTLLWERAGGLPLHNAIVWQDRRTADAIERLRREGRGEMLQQRTGLVPDAYFSASKIAWLLDNIEGARDRAAAGELAFGTIDSWLLYKLTGGALHATDASNASRTMLWDIHRATWDDELLELFDVPRALLPEVVDSSGKIADVAVDSLIAGLPIAGVAGDQQAALAGQLCFHPGAAKCTYGTGCFMLVNTDEEPVASQRRLLTTVAWQRDGTLTYALEGSVFIGGAAVQWLRDGLRIIDDAAQVEALAAAVPDSGDVYFVPAFAGLGAPHWDPYARGTVCGITRGTGAAHIARAALDAIAFQVADLLDAMREDTGLDIAALRVDGGACANNLLMQIQADLLQIAVLRPAVTETTALGAALLAGLAVGFWQSPADLESERTIDHIFEPRAAPSSVEERRARWAQAVERARSWERPTE